MLNSISQFFEQYLTPEDDREDEQSAEQRLHLASAALMIELSKSDRSLDDVEMQKLLAILESKFGLSRESLDELIALAEEEVREATSVYQFTSLFNDHYDYGQKVQLIHDLWQVAYADGNLDRYEEHLIRKVSDLIYVSHSDFIKTKLAVKEELEGNG